MSNLTFGMLNVILAIKINISKAIFVVIKNKCNMKSIYL